jgi:uncharacterized protein with GYD domain
MVKELDDQQCRSRASTAKRHKSSADDTRLGKTMPTYILLSQLTDEGWKTVKERPERIKEVNEELKAMGVKVVQQYAVLGSYDFINVVEAADNQKIAKVSIDLGSRGTIRLTTLPAIPIDDFIASLKRK